MGSVLCARTVIFHAYILELNGKRGLGRLSEENLEKMHKIARLLDGSIIVFIIFFLYLTGDSDKRRHGCLGQERTCLTYSQGIYSLRKF